MKIDIIRNNNDPFARYKMPKLEITTEGKSTNMRTVLTNLPDVAKSLKRSALMIIKYICNEKGTNYDVKSQKYTLKGFYKQNELQDMIYDFIEAYVLCLECNNPETFFISNKTIMMKCYACGSCNPIVKNKMYNLIEKEIGDMQTENKHYEDKEIEIQDAENFEDFLRVNQISKDVGIVTIVRKFDIERLIMLKDKILDNDYEILVDSIKDLCVEKNNFDKISAYIQFLCNSEIFDRDICHKLFMSKSKKYNKETNAKIRNVVKSYFDN